MLFCKDVKISGLLQKKNLPNRGDMSSWTETGLILNNRVRKNGFPLVSLPRICIYERDYKQKNNAFNAFNNNFSYLENVLT